MNEVNFELVETAVARHGCLPKKCGQFWPHFFICTILEETIYNVFLMRFYLALVNGQAFL